MKPNTVYTGLTKHFVPEISPNKVPQKRLSSKVLVLTWLAFATFVGMAYLCNLRAHILALELEDNIDTLQV